MQEASLRGPDNSVNQPQSFASLENVSNKQPVEQNQNNDVYKSREIDTNENTRLKKSLDNDDLTGLRAEDEKNNISGNESRSLEMELHQNVVHNYSMLDYNPEDPESSTEVILSSDDLTSALSDNEDTISVGNVNRSIMHEQPQFSKGQKR